MSSCKELEILEVEIPVFYFSQGIQQKLLWWEELTGLLQSQPVLLNREVSLRQSLIATTLEQLTSDDVLTFSHMEKILSEVQATLTEGLQLCTQGKTCREKTSVSFSQFTAHYQVQRQWTEGRLERAFCRLSNWIAGKNQNTLNTLVSFFFYQV